MHADTEEEQVKFVVPSSLGYFFIDFQVLVGVKLGHVD
jgi:hypothetical protein